MSRKPDYVLKAVTVAEPPTRTRVGAAYVNPNKSISIHLDPCIVLQKSSEYRFMLYPYGETRDQKD